MSAYRPPNRPGRWRWAGVRSPRTVSMRRVEDGRDCTTSTRVTQRPGTKPAPSGMRDMGLDECLSAGKPPRQVDVSGGTFAQNREYAEGRGCQALHNDFDSNYYCCPSR